MKRMTCYSIIFVSVVCVLVYGSHFSRAEELTFPTTEEEIIEALSVAPETSVKGRGGLKSSKSLEGQSQLFNQGTTRGLGGIVEDDKALEEAPKVGALILFDYNSAKIKAESLPLLRMYGKVLQDDLEEAVMVIAGHTDSIGSEKYNLKLSQQRAESVKKFLLTDYQITERRLIIKPYGEGKPIETNTTADGRAKNRRVEFIRIQ